MLSRAPPESRVALELGAILGSNGDDGEWEAVCAQAGVKHFPTWQFPDGERREGALSLQTLSQKSGCPLP